MKRNKSFTLWIIALPILAVLITSTILTYEFINYEKEELAKNIQSFEEKYINDLKNRIKNRVTRIANLIEANNKLTQEEEKEEIKNVTNIGFNIIKQTYEGNKNSSKKEIIQQIRNRLETQRFYKNNNGYFFILNLDNIVIMNLNRIEAIGKDDTNLQDVTGKYIAQSLTNIAKTKGEGFDTWYWKKPDSKQINKKIGYLKLFKPLGIYIVNAKYIDDIDKKLKKDAKKIIDSIKYSKDEYLFAINTRGTTISHINKEFEGKSLETRSEIEQQIISTIIHKGKEKNGGFIDYTPTSYNIDSDLSRKISYVKEIPSLKWIIGTGQYTKTLNEAILLEKEKLKRNLSITKYKILVISISISLILILILAYISKKVELMLISYESEVSKKNKKLKELNETLEKRVLEQIQKNREKEEILHHQSKLASMGEMLGNIAHQWRQPLSTISTAASGMKIQDELDTLDKKTMHYSLDAIVKSTKILSQTIDDFRNFFNKDKSNIYFNVQNSLKKVFTLIEASFKNKDITIIEDIQECELFGLENELTQALLNILSNAKDAVLENNSKKKLIFISSVCKDLSVHIKILDNGGGVKDDIVDKIFEPYFTTKFKSQGTGIGLYMTRTIIVNHMKGKLNIQNKHFTHEGKEYFGAEFEIILRK